MFEYRFQSAIEDIVRSTVYCTEYDHKDWGPLLFLAFLSRHEATLAALAAAGFDVEAFNRTNEEWLEKAADVMHLVTLGEAAPLDALPHLDEVEDPGILSWLANAGIHALSSGRAAHVIDVYDLLVAVKTVMTKDSALSRRWDAAGVTLLELRRRDAILHGPQGLYVTTPPETTDFMADFLDSFLLGDDEEEVQDEFDEDVQDDDDTEDIENGETTADDEVAVDASVAPVTKGDAESKAETNVPAEAPAEKPATDAASALTAGLPVHGAKIVEIDLKGVGSDVAAGTIQEILKRLMSGVPTYGQGGPDDGVSVSQMTQHEGTDEAGAEEGAARPRRAPSVSREEMFLQNCTRDLSRAAADGEIDPLIGRDAEVTRICEILLCRRKNKPLVLGETGAGKTALVEGLALRVHEGKVPPALRGMRIFALNAGALSSRYKGAFAEKLAEISAVIKRVPHAVLYIDNLHMLINGNEGNSQEEYNALGHLVGDDALKLITTSTFRAWRQTFSKDDLMTRRLQTVELLPVSKDEACRIAEGVLSKFERFHGVHYADDVVSRAVALADRWITDRPFPDKALDLIDELGGAARLNREADSKDTIEVTVEKLPELVARMARIPVDQITSSEHGELADLDKTLRETVYGQDEAIDKIVSAIRMSRSGLGSPDRPVGSFLFTGPTGVGKTEVARQLAKAMGVELLRFDMSEYAESHTVSRLIGSPPGYVGYGEGGLLTEQVTKHPYSVVLLDEMEKAHPTLFNLMLQVMDHGKLTDASGREADFRNAVIIMTSNVGARDMERSTIGFGGSTIGDDGDALKKAFTPEFRNRLDAVVRFAPLSRESVASVVDKFLAELTAQLVLRNVTPEYAPAFLAWLAEHGYDPHMGARPMRRLIADKVRRPLADELLFGRLAKGGKVVFDIRRSETPDVEDEVVFNVGEAN